jgi:predicted DNA-binding transcriptional regulator
MLLLLFGIFAMLTTAAVRGIVIILVITIVLNYIYRIRNVRFSVVFFAFLFPAVVMIIANEQFDLTLARDVETTSKRFEGAVQGGRKQFGLDESLFQRVGETIDVARTFSEHSPIFLVTGFGNGVLLDNRLITHSERGIYHTQKKHHIYIMPVAVLYHDGFIGLFLYGAIASYLVRILVKLRRHREILQAERKWVFIKVLVLYQIGVLLLSLIASWYIGSVVVAFTLPLIEILRKDMEKKIRESSETRQIETSGIGAA